MAVILTNKDYQKQVNVTKANRLLRGEILLNCKFHYDNCYSQFKAMINSTQVHAFNKQHVPLIKNVS